MESPGEMGNHPGCKCAGAHGIKRYPTLAGRCAEQTGTTGNGPPICRRPAAAANIQARISPKNWIEFSLGDMRRTFVTTAMILATCAAIAQGESTFQTALRTAEVSHEELSHASHVALWNSDQSAAVVAFHRRQGSLVLVLLRQPDGQFRVVDVSRVEDGNFSKLGFPRSRSERFETSPVEWLPRDDGSFHIVLRTRAWQSGKRYTASEPLIIRPDGTPLWR